MQESVDGLELPELLLMLLENGLWPRNTEEANAQNSKPRVTRERLAAVAPGEPGLFLYPPPFVTVASVVAREKRESFRFYHEFGALDQIDPERAVEIGDFGLGSDAPFILDYRQEPQNPAVLRLLWPRGNQEPNRWVLLAKDFASLVAALGLQED